MDIGYSLDFDEDGNQVDLIEKQEGRNPKDCFMLMVKTWIRSEKGKLCSWQTLLDILLSLDLKTAHDKVKEYLLSEQKKKLQDSIPTGVPVEATHNSLQSFSSCTSSSNNAGSSESLDTISFNQHQPIGSSQD